MEGMNGKSMDGRQIRVGRGFFRGGRDRGGGDRGFGSSWFDNRSGGYGGGSQEYYGSGRSPGSYGDRSYRDGYDSYASHE
ncbi:unnamed protein product [Staurois parvus]|uniref:Uncharacterized protein n=1 Tax=Staurois parvus TaxID=386267 RepID=A0ABN9GTS4_9NEOB|nr:unnamed protein product [Staurois parvus]